jgi:hypothetical protein
LLSLDPFRIGDSSYSPDVYWNGGETRNRTGDTIHIL